MIKFWAKKQTNKQEHIDSRFKKQHSLAERIQRRTAFKNKYPDSDFCVAVIEGLTELPSSQHNMKPYLVIGLQKTLSVMHIISYLKKLMKINESTSLIIIVGGNVVNMSARIVELGERYVDEDGFLYIYVKKEDSF